MEDQEKKTADVDQALEYLQSAYHNQKNVMRGMIPLAPMVREQIASAIKALGDTPCD